jgi:hypothetical protein
VKTHLRTKKATLKRDAERERQNAASASAPSRVLSSIESMTPEMFQILLVGGHLYTAEREAYYHQLKAMGSGNRTPAQENDYFVSCQIHTMRLRDYHQLPTDQRRQRLIQRGLMAYDSIVSDQDIQENTDMERFSVYEVPCADGQNDYCGVCGKPRRDPGQSRCPCRR